jgi:2-keto-4-pentenoate hydratase/2-oxohepta-3-ene-1,7-dioic acid hydratase in catechol pathway
MRLATYRRDGTPRLGVVRGEQMIDVALLDGFANTTEMLGLIDQGPDGLTRLRKALDAASDAQLKLRIRGGVQSVAQAHLLAPIPRPRRNLFCLGRNYLEHALERVRSDSQKTDVPKAPIFFSKATGTIAGPFDELRFDPGVSERLDWEVELGVILGRRGKNIPAAHALEHVFGYTVINDISARDLQFRHTQWFKGKSLDDSCPMGPWIVTSDEVADPHTLRLLLRVNGVVKQDSNTSLMIFNIPTIIETLSAGLTLEPGDIIATGTPAGVGDARTPPEYLQPGDVMETEIEGIGMLRNRIGRVEQPGAYQR